MTLNWLAHEIAPTARDLVPPAGLSLRARLGYEAQVGVRLRELAPRRVIDPAAGAAGRLVLDLSTPLPSCRPYLVMAARAFAGRP
jgi:hypothetical protein